jgi:hypothetical protein
VTDPFPTSRRLELDVLRWIEQLRHLGPLLAETNDGLVSWLDDLDGYPSRTLTDGLPTGVDPLNDMTAVERCADARLRVGSYRAQLIDDHTAVGQLIGSYLHTITQARGVLADADRLLAAEQGQPLCDGRHLEGADTPWTEWSRNPNNGWRREFCERIAVAHGLCDTCLLRHQRWRRRHGLPPLTATDPKDTQP